jgi:pimeloyl-ACP methyl ester carboxylesterase
MMKGVFLPGYACTSQIWQSVCEEIGPTYEPTLIDWPAHATPNFHCLDNLVDWLYSAFWPRDCDFIVGHSLGGLVALQLLASGKVEIPKTILVETFLLAPDPFFHNLLLSGESSDQAKQILEMLHCEEAHYSPRLKEAMREVDMSEQVWKIGKTIHALHGDRGCGSPEMVLEKLHWTEPIAALVELRVIPDSCHFPMVENPQETVQVLRSIIEIQEPSRQGVQPTRTGNRGKM